MGDYCLSCQQAVIVESRIFCGGVAFHCPNCGRCLDTVWDDDEAFEREASDGT